MPRRRALLAASAVLAVLLILASGSGLFSRDGGAAARASGAAGPEHELPFWVWRALPQAFPEYVPGPGGYLAFGFEWNRGEQLPVGLTLTEGAIPRIRSEPSAPGQPPGPAGVDGAPPDLEGYRAFLLAAARDPRFTADNILPLIQYNTRLSWLRRAQYRYLVIPRTRQALLRLEER